MQNDGSSILAFTSNRLVVKLLAIASEVLACLCGWCLCHSPVEFVF